jgi:hypothetical protein
MRACKNDYAGVDSLWLVHALVRVHTGDGATDSLLCLVGTGDDDGDGGDNGVLLLLPVLLPLIVPLVLLSSPLLVWLGRFIK